MTMSSVKCDVCHKTYVSKYTLARHKRTSNCSDNTETHHECACGYRSTHKHNYARHIRVCKIFYYNQALEEKKLELKEKDLKIETILRGAKEDRERLLAVVKQKQKELDARDLKIEKLTDDIINLRLKLATDDGKIEVYKERPGVVHNSTNTNVNNKLTNVKCDTIRPFTIETVREDLAKYTFEQYTKGVEGLIDFISSIITTDDDQRNYVCTDSSRHKFHRLLESREWKTDNGATFLNKVFDELKDIAKTYYLKVCEMMNSSGEPETADMIMQRTKSMFFAITQPKAKERPGIFAKVRNEVNLLAAV